jgi:hypothetical protein
VPFFAGKVSGDDLSQRLAREQAVAVSAELKRQTDEGALIIGRIKTCIIDEKQVVLR